VQFSIGLDERYAFPVKGHSEDFKSRTSPGTVKSQDRTILENPGRMVTLIDRLRRDNNNNTLPADLWRR